MKKNNLNSSCCQSNLLNTKKCVPTDKKSTFILILFIFLLMLNSCTKELNNFDDNSILSEEEETYQEFSKMRPFEAWLKTPTLKTRSSDSEITELIEYEKARFNKRFSFVEKYFKFIPVPQWESAKVVPYSKEETDIFILCENNYPDKFLLNKLVLVISKRGADIFSFIKMLPKDEYLGVSITAIHDGENVHLMTNQIESDGAIISQNLGYLTEEPAEDEAVTRSIDCKYKFVDNSTQTIITTGDGDIDVINDIDQWIRFVCDDYGSSGGTYAPPAGSGAGSIPGYTPPSFGSSNGSSGGSNDSGNSGGNSGGGNSGYDGGAGGNSGYPGGGGGSSGYPGGGGSSGGGNSSADNSTPAFPEGGIDLIPRPEFEDNELDEIFFDNSFTDTKAECIYLRLINIDGSFKNMIKKFDDKFSVSHLKFSINNNLGQYTYGSTIPPVNYMTEIQLNENSLNLLSDLGKATAIVHEIIHAEIFRKMLSAAQKGDLNLNEYSTQERVNYIKSLKDNFPGIFDYYVKRFRSTWNHNMMASHYRKIIANILQEFDSYRLNYSIYESIAWMGLRNIENNESTKAWNDLSPSEKQNVLNQINEHIFNGPSICN